MGLATLMKFLAAAVVFSLAFLLLRRLQEPKPKTDHLAITVWAEFGPYDTAKDAKDGLRRACCAVFGDAGVSEHKEWLDGHVKNFYDWQDEDRFQREQKLMRTGLLHSAYGRAFKAACQNFKAASP